MNLIKLAERDREMQNAELTRIPIAIKTKNGEKIFCKVKPSGIVQFYYKASDDSSLKYLSQKKQDIILKLHQREVNSAKRKILKSNIEALDALIANYKPYSDKSIYAELSKTHRHIYDYLEARGYALPDSSKLHKSQNIPQSEKPSRSEELKHTTTFGLKTRSKGEAMIADALYTANVPFQYEKKLVLAGIGTRTKYQNIPEYYKQPSVVIYPDFTIDIGHGEFIYWEHKGLMGDNDYFFNDAIRTALYFENEIYQPVNLIITCDGPDGSTDMEAIRRIITGIIQPLL